MRDDKAYFADILFSIERIESFLADTANFEEFQQSSKTIDAVERRLLIIGEAVNHLSETTLSKFQNIPFKKIIGLRNFLVHQYFGTSEKIIWDICQNDLSELKNFAREQLADGK